VVVYFWTATKRRSRGVSWSIIAPPFIIHDLTPEHRRRLMLVETRLQYHFELDSDLVVQDPDGCAERSRSFIREQLDWIADVVVHVEPFHYLERSR
jgi:hypothetical protein